VQPAHASKKNIVLQAGPFSAFNDRKIAIAIQKYMVPWSIAMFGYSFPAVNRDIPGDDDSCH
jgi:hypothetical protein